MIDKLMHTGKKLFSCGINWSTFVSGSKLKRRRQLHTGEEPFSCNIPGKVVATSGTFKRRKRIHTGEKTYFCVMFVQLFLIMGWNT